MRDPVTSAATAGDGVEVVLEQVRQHRQAAVNWLVGQVDDDGRPAGAEVRNAWWRAPWALVVAGAPDVAAALLGWVEREALQDDGDFREGAHRVGIPGSPVYGLSPVSIAAWLLGRYDTARVVADCMKSYQDPETGGVHEYRYGDVSRADQFQDNLKTAQLGISALVTGDQATAEGVAMWLRGTYELQPELPARYFPTRQGHRLLTEVPAERALRHIVDLRAPRQLFFHPGIAAAFLAGWAQQSGLTAERDLARDYLALSTNGTVHQFEDPTSVQICKYGWGAAAMLTADPDGGHLPAVVRMARWFCDRQRPDGAWVPSSFMTPDPGPLDLYWKTAEHTMELAYIEHALASAPLHNA